MEMKRPTLGFLYPGDSADDEIPRLCRHLEAPCECLLQHTPVGEDAHRVDALLDLGQSERLVPAGRELVSAGADVVIWACTSGSFVFGREGARRQAAQLSEALGVPASSTALAFEAAVRAIEVRRVAVAATYPHDVTLRFAEFLSAAGIEVLALSHADILTAAEVGTLNRQQVLDLACNGDHPQADALLIPDTALHSIDLISELERRLRKPVLTANQVSVWQALQLSDSPTAWSAGGTLFRC